MPVPELEPGCFGFHRIWCASRVTGCSGGDAIMNLNLIWFVILGFLLTGYGVLDGFDFGVGIFHLRTNKDEERQAIMDSIGPLWDGNEVWLVTFGGALFAPSQRPMRQRFPLTMCLS
jgi:hypothetical protein